MIYSGIIKNKQGATLEGALYAVITAVPNLVEGSIYIAGPGGAYSVNMVNDNQFLNVYAEGYQSTVYSQSELSKSGGVIILPKLAPVGLWMAGGLIAAFMLYKASSKKKGKKVGALTAEDTKIILMLGGGVIAFVLLKQILEFLGIWDSGNKKKLNQLAADPNSFWSPTFWQRINPSNTGWTYALTEDQAKALIKQIKGAFGILNDSPEQVKAVFRSLQTKANASFIAWEFQKTDGTDLLAYLRNGGGLLPWDGLSDADILQINDYINSLPNY